MEIKLPSFFVLSLPSHLMENFFNTIFNFNEFIFIYVVNIRVICYDEIYLLTCLSWKSIAEPKKPLQSRSDVRLTIVRAALVSDQYVWKRHRLAAWKNHVNISQNITCFAALIESFQILENIATFIERSRVH